MEKDQLLFFGGIDELAHVAYFDLKSKKFKDIAVVKTEEGNSINSTFLH